MNPTIDTEVAWCAGFFDGEGHVSYHRSYPSETSGRVSPQLYANVPQASDNIEVLVFFQSVVGLGKILGPYKMPNSNRTQHKLQFGIKEVEPLFLILRPYLRAEKTTDFQNALLGYWTHDSNPTPEDWERAVKRDMKKMSK